MAAPAKNLTDELLELIENCSLFEAEESATVRDALRDVIDSFCEARDLVADLEVQDVPVVDDLVELAYRSFSESFQNSFIRTVATLKKFEQSVLESLTSIRRCDDPAAVAQTIKQARRDILSLKVALRAAFRQRGGLPRQADSLGADFYRHTAGGAYEQKFIDEYLSHLGSNKLRAYVANCGMAAFSTVLHLLAHERESMGVAVGLQPMYFENFHLLKSFFPHVLLPETKPPDQLFEYFNEVQPAVVFFDAASNHGEPFDHNIDSIFAWARTVSRPLMLVIDTTCLPAPLLPADLLASLPDQVSVIIIESLAKHHQFGLDLVTGGIIVAHADEALQTAIRATRLRFGTNMSSASVATLPRPCRRLLVARMEHHSRNVAFLADSLERVNIGGHGVIESVTWLRDGVESPRYRTACFSLVFSERYRSLDYYRHFQNLVLQLARDRDHPFALGTSFGFDVTRLFVTSPAVASKLPFLRVAVGTETRNDLHDFLAILNEASTKMAPLSSEKSHSIASDPPA